MKSLSEMRDHLIEKAEENPAFRSRLIAEPGAVVKEEFGIEMPESFNLHVVEDDAENAWLILPPSSELTDKQLLSVAGGDWVWH